MSKNKKFKHKSIVPLKMSGKVFTSFSDLGSALGFKAPEQPTPKAKNCRKCGHPMRRVPGTNVWVCDGMVDQVDEGAKKQVPCGNRAITSVGPRPQSSENSGNPKPKKQGRPAQAQAATRVRVITDEVWFCKTI